MLLTLYIRREPATLRSTGHTQHTAAPTDRMDRVLYRDAAATDQAGLYPWWSISGPNRRSTHIVHNCFPYRLVWLDDLRLHSEADWQRHIASMPLHQGRVKTREVRDAHGQRAVIAYSC